MDMAHKIRGYVSVFALISLKGQLGCYQLCQKI